MNVILCIWREPIITLLMLLKLPQKTEDTPAPMNDISPEGFRLAYCLSLKNVPYTHYGQLSLY